MDFKNLVELSSQVLENENLEYQKGKQLIRKTFEQDSTNSFDNIYLRLTLIDALYSTQMNKRLYGIYDLTEKISKYDDFHWKTQAEVFIKNPKDENDINKLMKDSYGFEKDLNNSKKAISIISKYFYFLTNYNFPIYDSLAFKAVKILNNSKILENVKLNDSNYFEEIIELNEKSKINSFDKLDKCLWLFGKIDKGSLSLLLDKSTYQILIEKLNIKFPKKDNNAINKTNSISRDEYIKNQIFKNLDETKTIINNNNLNELLEWYKKYIY